VGLSRKYDPETSKKAALAMKGERLRDIQKQIVYHFASVTNATIEEASIGLGKPNLVRTPRFSELFHLGLIVPLGKRRVRKTMSGKNAMVWRLATPTEKKFIKDFVGSGFPSADTVLDEILRDSSSKRAKRLVKQYRKSVQFNTQLREIGIRRFMEFYG
jgi:hypothetical protein